MRFILPVFLFVFIGLNLKSQTIIEPEEGTVSYVTSQSIYVKFKSTENIAVGDTLFIKQGDKLVPALVVSNLSSISCICIPISSNPLAVSDKIFTKQKIKPATDQPKEEIPVAPVVVQPPEEKKDTTVADTTAKKKLKQDISGRVSLSSYSNFSNTPGGNSQRMRYTFSINAKNIGNSKLSGESYISFVHKDGEWNEIQQNIFNGLKIYSLAVNYEFNDNYRILLGRKINPKISNMGAIDGLQFEMKFNSFSAGILAGSRPDYNDYSFNFSLLQYGAYISHDYAGKKGNMQSSLAFVEQTNHSMTDRRFVYFQHSNSLIRNLNFFGTVECDLYRYDTVKNKPQGTFNLTNLYLSLRYRVIRQLSLSVSYSARQNVVYYETYKNILDQILDPETMQGFMFQVSYNPVKYLSVGVKTGYRYRKSDPKPSKNIYGYVTYSRIPVLNMSATLSATILETSYISGKIYSLVVSRDLVRGKLYGGLGYRYVDYKYFSTESSIPQNMAECNLNWIIYKKLSLSLNYEGTFEKINKYNRLYINVTQRF
ncbi:MAG: hypothetical protein M0Q51_11725 [Bacteroidales bacterium]|nr:hypothetical protein [Bacteroidales bacterium]